MMEKITLPRDPWKNCGKGYAYIAFTDATSVEPALALDGSTFKSRQIKVSILCGTDRR